MEYGHEFIFADVNSLSSTFREAIYVYIFKVFNRLNIEI